ncbi:GNAT family N-acetyltransferase [Streptomyces noursei]|uniref:GNAT family N-acetyltransferase n=1 Tax=Streptomyces noursei TaxID=1971 RepID=UPI00045F0A29|nr:GNAT family N-acetyltransferase [Streptomyces noursei]AIA08545.1 GCN5-related N-acetyltransferase [Streptomyces noursei]
MFTIRRACQYDGDILGEIHATAWEAAYAPFFAPEFAAREVQSRRTRWHERLAQGPRTILLAEHDSRPLAMSVSGPSTTRPGLAEIFTFFSHPDSWGSGIATALMTGTLDHLRNVGFAQVHLWTLCDTPQSRRFYTKCGFTECGTARTHDFGDGHPLDQVEYERPC